MFQQIRRFGVVGILATAIHIAVAYFAEAAGQLSPQLANLFGFLSAFLISYFGHLRYTFQPLGSSDRYFRRFLVLSALSFLTSSYVMYVLTDTLGVDFHWALAAIAVIVPSLTFIAAKFWAFSDATDDENDRLGSFVTLGLFAQLTVYFWFQSLGDINHDSAWYLVATQNWLAGAELYVDIIEVNPPWGFYWTVPIIWLSKLTGLDLHSGFFVFVGLLSAISLLCVWGSIKRISVFTVFQKLVCLELVLIAVLWFPMTQTGQREHIFVLCILPYLFSVFATFQGTIFSRSYRVALAVFALLGVLLKPYFAAVPLAVSIYEAVALRSFKPIVKLENWLILLGCLAYILFVRLVHPEYFSFILPIALTVYGSYGLPPEIVFTVLPLIMILLPLVLIGLNFLDSKSHKAPTVLAAAALGGVIGYYLQFTGYRYQSFPFYVFVFLYFALLLVLSQNRMAVRGFALLGLLASLYYGPSPTRYQNVFVQDIDAQIKQIPQGSAVMVLSTNVNAGFPAVFSSKLEWASRFPAQWLLPGALGNELTLDCEPVSEKCQKNRAILDYVRRANIEDIQKFKPMVIVVDRRQKKSYIEDESFDYISFMSTDTAFVGLWKEYQPWAETTYFSFWKKRN